MARKRRGLVADQLGDILDEAAKEVEKKSQDIFEQAARESEYALKAKSPRRPGGGEYANSWALKPYTEGHSKGYIVYNRDHYMLTHLLEKGHAKVNGGRVRGIPHIRPVEEAEIQRVLDRIVRMQL